MPRLSCWLIRTALVYLLLGFTLGGLMLWHKGLPIHPAVWLLLPAHMEFLLLGWTVQLVMGVAYWTLPRAGTKRRKSILVWFSYGLLNAGVCLVALSGFAPATALIHLTGRLMEAGAVTAFAIHAWGRVKPFGL